MNLMKQFYVYILASRSRNLYIGVTHDLLHRVYQHKRKLVPGFTARYNIDRLVYYEAYRDVRDAIQREKEIKGLNRVKKIALIEMTNPTWEDLSAGWYEEQAAWLDSE
jgi:putative endonuclease